MVLSETFSQVKQALHAGAVHVSVHARDVAVADGLLMQDIESTTLGADCIEDYPSDPRGPSCLVRCRAILITVYRPDPDRWSSDFRTRRRASAG